MKAKKISYIWFAPIITLGIMLVLYAFAGVFPFGGATTAFSDGLAQYVPLLAELSRKIKEGGSLLFSWHMGMGVNFWSNIAYYLASPLNLIVLFFEPSDMDKAYAILTLIKPVLMALTFGIYLKYTYKKNDLSIVIFSVLWSLSGFMIGGIFITSWYEAIIYFPIVMLGLKRLMDGKSGILYSVFLGLSIISNFYIGWMICIFSVLYFIYTFIADDEVSYEGTGVNSSDDKTESDDGVNIFEIFSRSYLLKTFFRFIGASLLAGCVTAIFSLPTLATLQNTVKGTTETSLINFKSFWGILASHIVPVKNVYDILQSQDYIFAFAGVVTIILCVAYFFTKGISVRKKLGNLFLLIVMWASIIFFPIYTIWHGFGIPAGIMYRFAFIYTFVLLKIAYETFIEIKNVPIYGIIAGTVLAGVCTAGIYFDKTLRETFFSLSLILTISAFIVLFTVILLVMSKKVNLKTILTVVLLVAVVGESIVLNRNNIMTYEVSENLSEYETVNETAKKLEPYEKMTFISGEQKFSDLIMYGSLFGFNGAEYYSSMADNNFVRTITRMGSYGNKHNSENGAHGQTPIYNMMFPTEYILDGKGEVAENFSREKISEKDGYTLYKNNYATPFMFTASNDIKDWNAALYPVAVDCQNSALKALTGIKDDSIVYNSPDNFSYENCTHLSFVDSMRKTYEEKGQHFHEEYVDFYKKLEEKMESFAFEITDMTKPASISFDSTAQADGMMYIFINTDEFVDMTVELNGKKTDYTIYGIGENRMVELGEVKKGDIAKIKIGGYHEEGQTENVYNVKKDIMSAIAFTIDRNVLDKAYNKLDAMSDTEMLEFSDTHVKAKVTSNEDGMLYIPTTYDEGWTILIDGVEAPLYEHESHILMTEITKGEHTVEMNYMPVGFVAGAVITGVSAAILIAWAVISYNRFKKERKSGMILANDMNEG